MFPGHRQRGDTEGVLLGQFVYEKEHDGTTRPRQTFSVGSGGQADLKGVVVSSVRLEVRFKFHLWLMFDTPLGMCWLRSAFDVTNRS